MSLCIRHGRLIDPANTVDRQCDVYIDDEGEVAGLGDRPAGFEAGRELDARGKIVCPGLVDLRARLREPGEEYKATIDSETRAAVAAGITTLCCPPDTTPVIDTPAMAELIQQRAWRVGRSFIHPLGALTRGLEGTQITDMVALTESGCVGLSNALQPVTDTQIMRRAMEYAASFDLKIFLHAEDHWLRAGGCVHEGEIATRLGLPGIPEAAEIVALARDLALVEQTGVQGHFCQLSTARGARMIGDAQRRQLPVSADVTAHHLHLSEHDIGDFNTQCHVRPPLRSTTDRDGLREAIADGVITVVCSDHQPHEPDAKLTAFSASAPGISALETLLPLTLRLVEEGVVPLSQALALITANPARVLGVDTGQLAVGATADVCIFDPQPEWELNEDNLVSRGHNTPFLGWRFHGRVTHTLIGGKLVYEFDDTAG